MRIIQELRDDEQPVHRIGTADLCELFGITTTKLAELTRKGTAVRIGHGAYDLEATTSAYVRHLRDAAAGRGEGQDGRKLVRERARLASEQADAQAIKNSALRGELVKADEVAREWADVLRGLRSRLLALPSRIRSDLGHLTAGDVTRIDRHLRDILTELGGGDATD